MVENLVVSKTGIESDNSPTNTIFSSHIDWEDNGANLIVYSNGKLLKPSEYSVNSNSQITLNSGITNTTSISMVITKLLVDLETIDRVSKKLANKTQTSINKKVYEEDIQSNFIIHSDEVWSSDISDIPGDAVSLGVAYEYNKMSLTEDVTVSGKKGWYASSNGQISGRIINWIPQKFSNNYIVRLYDNNSNEIVSSDPMEWQWDYAAGYLFIKNTHTYQTPLKISGHVYTGNYGGAAGGGASYWRPPVPTFSGLPSYGNVDGDVKLVLDENILYRWNNVETKWERTTYSSASFKDPVLTFASLPTIENTEGDFRLVLNENSIYRWNEVSTEWQSVINDHNHDNRYYQQSYIDTQINNKAEINHEHDTMYYGKTDVDRMVRWRPPVETEDDLPPYSENLDGDMMLTLDTKTIWRFDYFGFNQGEWIPVLVAEYTWREPVQTIGDLPVAPNIVGIVHMVLDEGNAYWWNGTTWDVITGDLAPHDHDDLYLRKEYIKWKYPATEKATLPTSDNVNGDVRLTLNDNSIYRWNISEWEIVSASPRWREPISLIADLPTSGNIDRDTRIVLENKSIYQWNEIGGVWEILLAQYHEHDDRYYTETELTNGILDVIYYRKTEVEDFFDINTGHSHDGVNSRVINYEDLDNIPYLYWKNPVVYKADLPIAGNTVGDARIVLDESEIYFWNGAEWLALTGEGLIAHDHDDRYYTETELDVIINDLELWVTAQLLNKADKIHTHDDLYYRENEIDNLIQDRFDTVDGHDHDGTDAKRISYYNLVDIPPPAAHIHDDRYYTHDQLQMSGDSLVHWDNLTNKPDLANGHWRSPVQEVVDLPMLGNNLYDIRMVLNDGDIYEWDGIQWNFVGHWDNQYVAYWREPIDTYINLPATNNVNGDVRLVLDENMLYRWDSVAQGWVVIATAYTDIMVYLNGLLLVPNLEYVRVKEKSVKILFPITGGHRLTLVLTGNMYLRIDFITYAGQQLFEISNKYHRQDWTNQPGFSLFTLTTVYTVGGNQLIVWLNGDLQRVGDDYLEASPSTFTLLSPLGALDHLTAIVMNLPSGEGEYAKEDYYATIGQTVFDLTNFFVPGSKRLLVYYNGALQKKDDDYIELSSSSIEMLNPCNENEHMSFIIFGTEVESFGGGCCNSQDVILGIPPDGTYLDGLLELYPETKVGHAVDEINEALLDIAPNAPDSIDGKLLETDITLYSGYVSNGNVSYEIGAGEYHNYLTEEHSYSIFTQNTTSFGNADKGEIKLFVNGTQKDSFRLYAAFVEDNDNSIQTALSYGIQSSGAREDEGGPGSNGAIRNSLDGHLSVMSVGKYNDFRRYQKGIVRINMSIALLRQGYNYIYLEHDLTERTDTSETLKIFYDSANNRPYIGPTIILNEEVLNSTKYCSGVRYYSIGDQFRTVFSAFRVFDNTYSQVPVILDMSGLQPYSVEYDHVDLVGPSTPPALGDFFDFNGVLTLDEYNQYNIDALMEIQSYDPFGTGGNGFSNSDNKLINTYLNSSTDLIEYFRDELYRLPEDNYDIAVASRTNEWDSALPLTEGNALLFDEKLMYAVINFLPYNPTQVVNYSSFSGDQEYFRSFYKYVPKNSGTFTIDGMSLIELSTSQILIDIKLPSQTGWLSLNNPYDVGTFTGSNGDGCLLNSSGNQFTYSSGTFSTANSGYMIIVRITLPSTSAPQIEYMELQW